jgi:dynamin-binding protein
MKAVERGRSPSKADIKSLKVNDPNRRRKISMGPIDFDARREQIKLSYTKSIQETEAKAAAKRQAILEHEKRKREKEEEEAAAHAAAVAAAAEKQREEETQAELELAQTSQPERRTVDVEARISHREIPREVPEPGSKARAEHFHQPVLTVTTTSAQERPAPVLLSDAAPSNSDSPTLGIPGSFPPLGAPNIDDDVPPQSAVSDTTEFDGEPQTEPPIQQSLEVSTPDLDRNAASKDTTPVRVVAHYRSPFDDSPTDETASIRIALEEIPAEPVELAIVSDDTGDDEPSIPEPQQYDEDEYIPRPYVAAPSYETTVTIIGRSGFPEILPQEGDQVSSCDAQSEEATPDEDQPLSPSHKLTKSSISHSLEARSSDEYSDRDTPLGKLEEFYIGPKVAESTSRTYNSSSRVSTDHTRTWSGEKNEHSADFSRISVETKRTTETRPSLTVPRTSNLGNRSSQNTVWTDYSMDSKEEFPDYSVKVHKRDSAYREADSSSTRSGRGSRMYPSSPETSPHGSYRSPRQTLGNGHRFPGHQLPELDTGGGFAVDYGNRKQSSSLTVPLPDHSPPPPPEEAAFPDLSSAPVSEYYDDTRPNSYLHGTQDEQGAFSPSRPQSESFDLPSSTPRSTDHGSLDISERPVSTRTRVDSQTTLADSLDQQENSTGLPAKERKRLFTRLETIKELIDTEAFFIRDMNIVEEIYKGTAEACPKLDDNTIKLIFRNTDQIIAFHTTFLTELKEGVSSVYVPKNHRSLAQKESSSQLDGTTGSSPVPGQLDDAKDRETSLGPIFQRNMDKMKVAHETFLKNSDHAAKRLIQIQEDPTVKVWLNECNEVARDLTKAWNLDSLLIKPMQRITKYPNLLIQLLHETPADHPDRPALETAKGVLEDAIEEINKTKKNFELVGQIVGRKRKDSNVGGFARAFGKRVDKLQAASNRPPEDAEYLKLHEKFGDDYLRLQVVLRDVEFYTRQVTAYVHEFLQYLSSIELVMRLQPSPHPEIESKWVRFNVSMRDIEKVALEQHLSHVRKQVIEPFEQVIKAYSNPSLAMKKRSKRRLDYEKSVQLKKGGKKLDKQLAEAVEQYDALNEALKTELPKLSTLTEKVGNICLGNFVSIQTQWFSIWKEKVKVVLESQQVPEIPSIMSAFQQDYKFLEEQMSSISILNPASKPRTSQSTSNDDAASLRLRPRPSETSVSRGRGLSVNSDMAPNMPTPDFAKRHSGQFVASPSNVSIPSPPQFHYRDYYAGITANNTPATPAESATPNTPDLSGGSRPPAAGVVRPGTGQSHESGGAIKQSTEWNGQATRYSNSMYSSSGYQSPPEPAQTQRFSGLFHSALPMADAAAERSVRPSRASSRASSRERQNTGGYNVLWLAASLFEFNIETTKHEAGYPYLTYQAGEVSDL